ncbi:MAG: hypothetical protein AB8H47_01500 [Bacteroidia bacterium]
MTKHFFLAIWLAFGLFFTLNAQITNAFGQIGGLYNTNNNQFAFREHRIWLNTAVGISIGRHFDVGVRMNQLWLHGLHPYWDHMWEGGPFVRAKWNIKEYHHLYAELRLTRGNICTCGDQRYSFLSRESGRYHVAFAHGFTLKIAPNTHAYSELYWNFPLENAATELGYLNASLGIRYYLRIEKL